MESVRSPRRWKWSLVAVIPLMTIAAERAIHAAAGQLHVWQDGEVLTAKDINANFAALAAEGVPSGAVLAFDSPACPTGWSSFQAAAGRTIVGVNADSGNGLSVRKLEQTFGEETHALTAGEIPSHRHTFGIYGGTNSSFTNGTVQLTAQGGLQQPSTFGSAETDVAGGNAAHNNMQPSIALLFCKKN